MYEEGLQESKITSEKFPDQVGGFEEQGTFQHVEMEVAFWSADKSMRKDTEKKTVQSSAGAIE